MSYDGMIMDCDYPDICTPDWKRDFVKLHVNDMLNVCASMIEFDGLPETIPERELIRILQTHGYALAPIPSVLPNNEPLVFFGTMSGVPDYYHMPTETIISNPRLPDSLTLTIHKDVVIIRHDSYFQGLLPIITRYGALLADAYQTLYIATINSRVPAIISAETNNTYTATKDFFKAIRNGELSGVYDQPVINGMRVSPYANAANSEITNIIELIQYLTASEWNKLGLNANYNMKREAINSAESQMNNEALYPLPNDIIKNIQTGLDEYNALTGYNITVKLGSAWRHEETNPIKEGETNETNEPETESI